MATIHFVDANNNIGQVYSFSSQIVPRCIVSCDQNGTANYIPTDGAGYSSYDENMGSYTNRYYYNSHNPSIHAVASDNSICNAYNAVSTISNVSIPAGTYTPSAFENLISQYISANGSRNCVNAFTAKVNGITYNVSAGQAIKYCTTNTAGSGTNSTLRIVTFNGRTYAQAQDANRLYFEGTYVVYASNFSGHAQFSAYANYSITIGTGIIFN